MYILAVSDVLVSHVEEVKEVKVAFWNVGFKIKQAVAVRVDDVM